MNERKELKLTLDLKIVTEIKTRMEYCDRQDAGLSFVYAGPWLLWDLQIKCSPSAARNRGKEFVNVSGWNSLPRD